MLYRQRFTIYPETSFIIKMALPCIRFDLWFNDTWTQLWSFSAIYAFELGTICLKDVFDIMMNSYMDYKVARFKNEYL